MKIKIVSLIIILCIFFIGDTRSTVDSEENKFKWIIPAGHAKYRQHIIAQYEKIFGAREFKPIVDADYLRIILRESW